MRNTVKGSVIVSLCRALLEIPAFEWNLKVKDRWIIFFISVEEEIFSQEKECAKKSSRQNVLRISYWHSIFTVCNGIKCNLLILSIYVDYTIWYIFECVYLQWRLSSSCTRNIFYQNFLLFSCYITKREKKSRMKIMYLKRDYEF